MNQRAEDVLFAKIRQLPAERLAQIADFVDFLATQERRPEAIERQSLRDQLPPKSKPADVRKVIVAVHGIGDQIANTTAQSVAFRVFDYYNKPPAIPLGGFHPAASAPPGVVLLRSLPDPVAQIGFAEVYWADIPRKVRTKGFTLEEAKQWARTIVARLNEASLVEPQDDRARKKRSAVPARHPYQYRMLETVVDELVDAVFVLDNLTFLADRAGLFKFDLKKVLNDFLNDVQVVTEFEEFRDAILKKFDDVMKVIANDRNAEGAEIYIVGHSEGSVIAFFGLLTELSKTNPPAWVDRVRGLMTIGSPIEAHRLLWTRLWNFKPSERDPSRGPIVPIVWWNYFDYGDPIAYRLTETRQWMKEHKWQPFFHHTDAQDVAFARYVFPGKAHVDYWKDKELFAHFFENVVKLPPVGQEKRPKAHLPQDRLSRATSSPMTKEEKPQKAPLPQDRWYSSLIASVFPYVLVCVLMFLAVYFLYTPLAAALGAEQTSLVTLGNLAGLTLLLAGMTVVVRIPRLALAYPATPKADDRHRPPGRASWFLTLCRWSLAAQMFLLAAVVAYPILVHLKTQKLINDALAFLPLPSFTLFGTLPFVIVVATLIALLWSLWHPARGVWPLLVPGALLALFIVVHVLTRDQRPSLWPVLLGSAAFLYLWWLATLLFDLSVVWHSYVRWSKDPNVPKGTSWFSNIKTRS